MSKKKVGGIRAKAAKGKRGGSRMVGGYTRIPDPNVVLCTATGIDVDRRLVCPECGYHPGLANVAGKGTHAPGCVTEWRINENL